MSQAEDGGSEEIRRLQGCINDLMSVVALPALWSGREASEIVTTLLDGLVGMLRLDFAYARLTDGIDGSPAELVRLGQRRNPSVPVREVGLALSRWLTHATATAARIIPNPLGPGEVTIAPFRLGVQDEIGVLVAGSQRTDFPTQVETLLLRVAANETAIGLQEARRSSEQRLAARDLEQRVTERTEQLAAANEELRRQVAERKRAEAEQVPLKDELAAELVAMSRLHELSTRLLATTELQPFLEAALDGIIAVQNADFGNVQLYRVETQALEIVAQRGFQAEFLDYFSSVQEDSAACGRALQRQERIIIEDVQADSGFAPHRRIAASAGFRAVQSTPLFSRSGEPLGMLSTHFRRPHRPSERELRLTDLYAGQAAEMIEMKRTEQALRASEASLVEGQRISQTGSWNWKVVSGEMVGSLELRRIFGFESEAARPPYSRYVERVHPDDRTSVEQTVDAAVQAGDSFRIDYRIVLPNGAVKYLHGVGHPVANGLGDRPEYVGTVMDVTERKRAEEALRKAQDELAHVTRVTTMGELAASIAHEVNQPLAAVVANANASLRWLAAEPSNIPEARDGLQRIVRDANRASEVVSRIRAFLKRGESRRARVDVEDVIREVIGLVQGEVRTQGVSVQVASAANLPAVTADRVQLQQVILNLVINAIEAMTPIADRPRLLEVKADTYHPDAILVAVRDSGVGFDPQRRERIFDAFYSTKPHGMGMGLAISRSIVEAHGGRLWATPNDGYGETFQLTLPVDRCLLQRTV